MIAELELLIPLLSGAVGVVSGLLKYLAKGDSDAKHITLTSGDQTITISKEKLAQLSELLDGVVVSKPNQVSTPSKPVGPSEREPK